MVVSAVRRRYELVDDLYLCKNRDFLLVRMSYSPPPNRVRSCTTWFSKTLKNYPPTKKNSEEECEIPIYFLQRYPMWPSSWLSRFYVFTFSHFYTFFHVLIVPLFSIPREDEWPIDVIVIVGGPISQKSECWLLLFYELPESLHVFMHFIGLVAVIICIFVLKLMSLF